MAETLPGPRASAAQCVGGTPHPEETVEEQQRRSFCITGKIERRSGNDGRGWWGVGSWSWERGNVRGTRRDWDSALGSLQSLFCALGRALREGVAWTAIPPRWLQ